MRRFDQLACTVCLERVQPSTETLEMSRVGATVCEPPATPGHTLPRPISGRAFDDVQAYQAKCHVRLTQRGCRRRCGSRSSRTDDPFMQVTRSRARAHPRICLNTVAWQRCGNIMSKNVQSGVRQCAHKCLRMYNVVGDNVHMGAYLLWK